MPVASVWRTIDTFTVWIPIWYWRTRFQMIWLFLSQICQCLIYLNGIQRLCSLSLSLSPPTSTQVASNLNTIWTNSICQSLSNHDGMNVAGWVDQWMIHPLDCWGLIKRLAGWLLIGPVVKFWCTGPWWRYKNITDGIRLIEIIRVTLR